MAAETEPAVLRVANAVRRYKTRTVLNDVSLSVLQGEVYALIGRNGAGKSTLVKAAIGALALDEGTVTVLGLDPARDPAARRAIGVAPQEIALYDHLTIAENLAVFATLSGVEASRRPDAARRAMEDAGCAERAGERLGRLSGGWRRRANLAAAIVHRPKLLILDEPTEGLDAENKRVLQALIGRLRADRTAILLISHDADAVTGLADRIGILHDGRLATEGVPDALMGLAFEGRQELSVKIASGAPAATPLLQASGLRPSAQAEVWTGVVADAVGEARRLDQGLRDAGVDVSELTVRRPGLDSLITWAVEAA